MLVTALTVIAAESTAQGPHLSWWHQSGDSTVLNGIRVTLEGEEIERWINGRLRDPVNAPNATFTFTFDPPIQTFRSNFSFVADFETISGFNIRPTLVLGELVAEGVPIEAVTGQLPGDDNAGSIVWAGLNASTLSFTMANAAGAIALESIEVQGAPPQTRFGVVGFFGPTTHCADTPISVGSPATLPVYVWFEHEGARLTGSGFRITGIPAGWNASFEPAEGSAMSGDPFSISGAFVVLPTGCGEDPPYYVGALTFVPIGEVDGHRIGICGSLESDSPTLLRCSGSEVFAADGGAVVLTPGGASCHADVRLGDCALTSIEASTWGGLKRLYR